MDSRKEGPSVAEMVQKLKSVQLPPHVLKALRLDKDWAERVPLDFVEKVRDTAQRYSVALKELSKH